MDRLLYVAMSGAEQTMLAQTVNANNLANASTNGFKADLLQYTSVSPKGEGLPTRVYALSEQPEVDANPGPLMKTGRDLDVAIKDKGWFVVQTNDGAEAYTRSGSFKISEEGMLTTASGLPVLGDGGPITLGSFSKVNIGDDGTISIIPQGGSVDNLVLIDKLKLVNPEINNIKKDEMGYIRTKDNSTLDSDLEVSVASGYLESSNVNPVQELTTMIALSRQFELQVKMMEQAEQAAKIDSSLLSIT